MVVLLVVVVVVLVVLVLPLKEPCLERPSPRGEAGFRSGAGTVGFFLTRAAMG